MEKASAARQAALRTEYVAYVGLAERSAQRSVPSLYAAFAAERERTREAMTGGLFQASAETLAKFDREDSRLLAFAEYFHNRPQPPVLDFEEWAKQRQPPPIETTSANEQARPVQLATPSTTERGEPPAGVGDRGQITVH